MRTKPRNPAIQITARVDGHVRPWAARWGALWAVAVGLLGAGGCASPAYEESKWADGPPGGRVLRTDHYDLHTTIPDRDLNAELAATMERSYRL